MKSTAIAPSNIAFIKYWGRKDEILRLPANGSISMNLSNLLTITTVEFDSSLKEDEVIFNGNKEEAVGSRAIKHLDRIRNIAGINTKAKVVTENNFPTSTGLSSSSSGLAALTVAASSAAGLKLPEKELSILARQGSGSACRSIPDGFVEWLDGDTSKESYAVTLYAPDYWDIADIVAIVSKGKKQVSSSTGHAIAGSSPFFSTRLSFIKNKIKQIKNAIKERDFKTFGEIVEQEALELHAIYITSNPSLIYLRPESLKLILQIPKWRNNSGLAVYFSLNTGQDVHIICQKKDSGTVVKLLEGIDIVGKTIINYPAKGASFTDKHLF